MGLSWSLPPQFRRSRNMRSCRQLCTDLSTAVHNYFPPRWGGRTAVARFFWPIWELKGGVVIGGALLTGGPEEIAPLFGFYVLPSSCRWQRQIEHKDFFTARTRGHDSP